MKIFCIGLSRTGTSSLNNALNILGYRSKHYPVHILNHDMTLRQESILLKQFDAFSDTPIAICYKELDILYPNSKFILTVRDKNSWLTSCEKFFPTRKLDHFSKEIRLKLYNSYIFNRDTFSIGYDNHIYDVMNYFNNRMESLLIYNVNDGWHPLCTFLNKKIPQENFPHLNRSKN